MRDEAVADAAGADALLFEGLSAWMDGEALPAGIDQEAVLQWLLHDAQAHQKWQCWHASAACLHGDMVDAEDRSNVIGVAAVGSAAWSQRLRQELADVQVGYSRPEVGMQVQREHVGNRMSVVAAQAANDPFWRWKMAAGFASLAAVGVMVWSLFGQPPMTGMPQQVVAHSDAAVQPASAQAQANVVDHRAVEPAAGADPYIEALMLAHAQLGENILLQDVLSTE